LRLRNDFLTDPEEALAYLGTLSHLGIVALKSLRHFFRDAYFGVQTSHIVSSTLAMMRARPPGYPANHGEKIHETGDFRT
jgi:hypothetical protein